jgi:hypothetical protein
MQEEWLKTQSESRRKRAREPQNFFKHGHRVPNKQLHYVPYFGEMLMYDSCICFEHLAKKMRPLLEAYMLRFVIEHPEYLHLTVPLDDLLTSRGLKLSEVPPLSRPEFLKRVPPVVTRFLAA